MTIEEARLKLPFLLYDELELHEENELYRLIEQSPELQTELERLRALHVAVDTVQVEPPPGLLSQCRSSLHRTLDEAVRPAQPRRVGNFASALGFLGSGFSWKPVAAFAMLALAFVGGRFTMQHTAPPAPVAMQEELPPMARVREVRTNPNGTVQIRLEEVNQKEITGSLDDQRVRDILLTAARQTNDPGLRVGTIDLLKSQSEHVDVREALLHALRSDSNAGVRMKALEGLAKYVDHAEVRDSLRAVLLRDDSAAVRMEAIDLLIKSSEGPETIGLLQQVMQLEKNSSIRQRCQNALIDLNATTETF